MTPPPAAGQTVSLRTWTLGLVLVVVTIAVYANSLAIPFILDDTHAVQDNATIRTLTPLGGALAGPPQTPTAGRPLVNLSFAINYAWGGLSPWGYHAWNLVVHILNGLLLFGIIRRTLEVRFKSGTAPTEPTATRGAKRERRSRTDASKASAPSPPALFIAFACALLWLLHPLQTELVDYVTQRTESMMALAYFATLYAVIRSMTAARPAPWYALAIGACAAGMACKESMASAPLIVLLYDSVFWSRTPVRALRQRPLLYAGLAMTWIVVVALIASGPRSNTAGFSAGVSPLVYLFNQAPMILRYIRLSFWPSALVFDYGLPQPMTLQDSVLPGVAIVLLLGATLVAWRRHRPLAFLGTWFFVTLAPASSIIPISTEVGAERRMYLPLAALVIVVVMAVQTLTRRRAVVAAALLVVATVLGGLTIRRNAEYHSALGLWQTVLDRYPNGRAHYNLGIELKAANRRDDAIREYQIAARDVPDAAYALGFELAADGKHDEAVAQLREYVRLRPDDINVIRAYKLLGLELFAGEHVADAEAAFRQVLRMRPRDLDALEGLGQALLEQRRFADAVATYQDVIRIEPTRKNGYFNLGIAMAALGRKDEAIVALTTAVEQDPRDADFRLALGSGLKAIGRFHDASDQYRRAAELQTDPKARAELTQLADQLAAQKDGR